MENTIDVMTVTTTREGTRVALWGGDLYGTIITFPHRGETWVVDVERMLTVDDSEAIGGFYRRAVDAINRGFNEIEHRYVEIRGQEEYFLDRNVCHADGVVGATGFYVRELPDRELTPA